MAPAAQHENVVKQKDQRWPNFVGQRISQNCEEDVTVESREVGEATVLCQVLPPPFPAFTPSNPELKQPLGFLDSISLVFTV